MTAVIQDLSTTKVNWATQGEKPVLQAPDLIAHIYGDILFPKRDPNISRIAVNHGFTVADWTWSQRCASDLFEAIGTLNAHPSNPLLANILALLADPGASVAYQALGLPSGTYGWTGILQMIENYYSMTFCQQIGDTKGESLAKLSLVKNATLTAGGLCFLGYRPTAIACAVEKISYSGFNAPTLLGRITYAFVTIGIIFFSLCYLMMCLTSGTKIYQADQFKEKLEKQIDQMQFLLDRLDPNSEKLKAHHPEKHDVLFNEKELIQEALNYGSQVIKDRFKELSDEESVTLIWNKVTAIYGAKTETALMNLGQAIRLKKWALKKETKLARLTSAECVELIKQAQIDPSKAEAALEKVKETLDANRTNELINIALCTLGAVFMMAGIFVTGGIGAVVIAAVMLAVCLIMFKLDHADFETSLEVEAPGKYDKALLMISTVLCVISICTVVGLMAAGLLALTAYPLIITLVLSSVWLVYNKEAWDGITKKERLFAEAHPTLDFLLTLLEEGADKKKIDEIVKKLPSDVQELLEAETDDLKLAALKTKEKIAQMQKTYQDNFLAALRGRS